MLKRTKQRNLIAKDLYVNRKFKHKVEKAYKEVLNEQEKQEALQELKDYKKNGTSEI